MHRTGPDGLEVRLDDADPAGAPDTSVPAPRGADERATAPGVNAVALPALLRSPIATAVCDDEGRILELNAAVSRLLDREADDLLGRSLFTLCHPDDASGIVLRMQDLLSGRRDAASLRARLYARDGEVMHTDVALVCISERAGDPPRMLVQLVDVGTEVANYEVLQKTAHQFRLMAENASDVVFQAEPCGAIRWVSPSVAHVLGWEPAGLAGVQCTSLVAPEDIALLQSLLGPCPDWVRSGAAAPAEQRRPRAVVRFRTLAGAYRDMEVTSRPIGVDDEAAGGAVLGLRDVTDEEQARRTLARSEERFRLAMASAPHGMAIADGHGYVVQVNQALCDLTGRDRAHLLGRHVADLLAPEDLHLVAEADAAILDAGMDSLSQEHALVVPGRDVWVVHAVSVTRDERGVPVFYVHQFVDQTQAHDQRADLEFRASRDGLTGATNRAELMAHLHRRLSAPDARGLGVLFVDIDNLKPINDTFGHKGGDDAITAVARRLSDAVRHGDVVARIGGDEFVVVLENMPSLDVVSRVAEKCRAAVAQPVASGPGSLDVTVSVGAVLASPADTADHVLLRADRALYSAKQTGRNQVALG
jgi:diguanylate cyclase (GGDEF)-like protein/PAS domain S-box-containing protein